MKKIRLVEILFNLPDHYRVTLFVFELRLYGKDRCNIYYRDRQNVRLPKVKIGHANLCAKVMLQTDLPVPNIVNPNYYLLLEEFKKDIDKKKISLENPAKYLNTAKDDIEKNKLVKL